MNASASAFNYRYARTEEEKALVAAFVDKVYRAKYGTAPPIPDIYAFVADGASVIAAMGVEGAGSDGTFQIERTYRIHRQALPVAISAENCVQLGRWVSVDPRAGLAVVLGAVSCGIDQGKSWAFVEHDAAVHRHCERSLGITFISIEHSAVDLAALPESVRGYYAASVMKPYLVNLYQMRIALSARVRKA